MSVVATVLILVSNDLQRDYDNESRIGISGQHATRLSGDAFEAGSLVELDLAKQSNHIAIAAIVADDVVTEHGAIVGLTNFDQPDFKSSDIDTEATTSLDERTEVVGASLSPKHLQRPQARVETTLPTPSSSQKFDHADMSPRELVPAAARGGPKIELGAVEPSIPGQNAIMPHFRVQIAAVRDEANAQRVWARSQTHLGVILADLEPYFERAETSNGVFYRIQTGPFQSRSEARHFCARLKERDVTCFVVAL